MQIIHQLTHLFLALSENIPYYQFYMNSVICQESQGNLTFSTQLLGTSFRSCPMELTLFDFTPRFTEDLAPDNALNYGGLACERGDQLIRSACGRGLVSLFDGSEVNAVVFPGELYALRHCSSGGGRVIPALFAGGSLVVTVVNAASGAIRRRMRYTGLAVRALKKGVKPLLRCGWSLRLLSRTE